jgi:hypothetical protein
MFPTSLPSMQATPSPGSHGKGNTGDACTCGRDERVRGYLELLAGVDETEAAG